METRDREDEHRAARRAAGRAVAAALLGFTLKSVSIHSVCDESGTPNHRRDAARNLSAGLLVQNPQLLGDSGPTGETGRAGELYEKHGIARLAPDDADDS